MAAAGSLAKWARSLWPSGDVWTFVLGFVARLVVLGWGRASRALEALLVGTEQGHDLIIECWFRRSRGLALENAQCSYATGELLVNPLLSAVGSSGGGGSGTQSFALGLLAFAAQVGVCRLLYKAGQAEAGAGVSWRLYWLNPLSVLSVAASPLPSINHLLFTAAWAVLPPPPGQAFVLRPLLSLFCFLWLASSHAPFLSLAPALLALAMAPAHWATSPGAAFAHPPPVFDLLALFALLAACAHSSSASSSTSGPNTTRPGLTYVPGAGVLWYVDAQVFPTFAPYFSLLASAQPFVLAAPVYLRFAPHSPLLAFHVTAALVAFFAPKTSLADAAFALATLALHARVTRKMRHLPWVAVGLVLPTVLSPSLLSLWLDMGSGNANFLFFQGLAQWVCVSAGLVDFVTAARGLMAAGAVAN